MDHALPDYLLTLNFFIRAAVPVTLLAGIWVAVRRTSLSAPEQARTWAVISAALLGWFGLAWWLAQANAFVVGADQMPRIQFAIVIPIVAGLFLLLRSRRGRRNSGTAILARRHAGLSGARGDIPAAVGARPDAG